MTAVARTLALLAVVAAIFMWTATPSAEAISPTGAVCALTGLVSSLAAKLCDVAAHPGRVLSAGKQLLGGHLGGALESLGGAGGSTAARAVGLVAIATAVVGGARYLLAGTAKIIGATTRPNLTSTWFSATYWRMAAVSALLTVPFLFAAAVQAMIRSDLSLLARAAFGYLPVGMLAVGVAAPLTMLLLAGSDEMSALITSASGHASTRFLDLAGGLGGAIDVLSGSVFVTFFIALLTAAATLTLWIELLIRDAAVYVIVLMLPLFFAAMVWPARRVWAIRAVELLVALILSKFAIVAVLSLGGAALGHALLPGPAAILSGTTLVMLAAFSPWALMRLLPLHEVAAAAVGGLRPRGALPRTADRTDAATDAAERLSQAHDPLSEGRSGAGSAARGDATAGSADAVDGAPAASPDPGERDPLAGDLPGGDAVAGDAGGPAPSAADPFAPGVTAGDDGSAPTPDRADTGTSGRGDRADPRGPFAPEFRAPNFAWRKLDLGEGLRSGEPLVDSGADDLRSGEPLAAPGAQDAEVKPPAADPESPPLPRSGEDRER